MSAQTSNVWNLVLDVSLNFDVWSLNFTPERGL